MAGMKVVVVNTSETGDIDLEDLSKKASEYKDELAAIDVLANEEDINLWARSSGTKEGAAER